jgi:hypothetical protein
VLLPYSGRTNPIYRRDYTPAAFAVALECMFLHLGRGSKSLVVIAGLSLVLLVLAPAPSFAGDVDCMDTLANCFGQMVGKPVETKLTGKTPVGGVAWIGTDIATVYQKGGVYTYVYDFELFKGSTQMATLFVGFLTEVVLLTRSLPPLIGV